MERHTFTRRAARAGVEAGMRDAICGSVAKFLEAVERFVGDLLRRRLAPPCPSASITPLGNPASTRTLSGTTCSLGCSRSLLVISRAGQPPLSLLRPRPDAKSLSTSGCFGGPGVKCSSTFAVVDAVKLRELEEVAARPEAGGRPASSLRQHHLGRTLSYGSIRIVEYKCTPETERFEADIRELNEFLARFTLTGGTHYGYTRVFNNRSWRAGGRVWSAGEYSYQQMRETERLKMTINGEPVAEIDIKASQLTIYPAMIGDLDATEL
jgi:hypothetical protein